MKCPHYKICISNSNKEHLCNDSKCKLNKQLYKKELTEKRQGVRDCIDEIKRELNIESFLELNNK